MPKPAEALAAPSPAQTLENSEPAPVSQLQSRLEPKPQPPVAEAAPRSQEATEAAPSCVGDMADTPRDAGLKQVPAPRNEKAPVDFGYVGIDSILEQMRRKAMKQGFEFNIMVVGESSPRLPLNPCGKPASPLGLVFPSVKRGSNPDLRDRLPVTLHVRACEPTASSGSSEGPVLHMQGP
uniref:SEPT9 n=1 Tax=Colobus angolensis palliatus TaxID=336983 RepID=A0A2K5JW66_COLAP